MKSNWLRMKVQFIGAMRRERLMKLEFVPKILDNEIDEKIAELERSKEDSSTKL